VRRRLLVLLGTTILAVPAAAHARPDTIEARGSANGFGRVLAIGDFKPARDPTYGAAAQVFGEPGSERRRDRAKSCIVNWPGPGVRITFANFGVGSACDRDLGRSQSARAYGRHWRTKRGLRVGARASALHGLYPHASRHGRRWWLVTGISLIGVSPDRYPVLAATVRGGRVRSFTLWIGAAGD
jgi:hypothetical protein